MYLAFYLMQGFREMQLFTFKYTFWLPYKIIKLLWHKKNRLLKTVKYDLLKSGR